MKKNTIVLLVISWLIMNIYASLTSRQNEASGFSGQIPSTTGSKLAPDLTQKLSINAPESQMTVTVILKDQADLPLEQIPPGKQRQQAHIEALQFISQQTQKDLRSLLALRQAQGSVAKFIPLWIFNGIIVTAEVEVIRELAARPEVYRIEAEQSFQAPPMEPGDLSLQISPAAGGVNANINAVNAPALWDLGFRGQGVVVGIMDTGVDGTHPDLSAQYRGGSNSWYDPYGENAIPTDNAGLKTGHGTAVMSVIVGRSASGSAIGVAPDATWIAAKIFNNQGSATTTMIHLAMQWMIDPDRNPATADAPHVLNNSWTYSSPICDLSLQLDLRNLRAAGILPIYSAGNFGPASSTGSSPANLPEAVAVGAVDNSGLIASFSSRGPETCGRTAPAIYPALVAPGVNIPVASPGGGYVILSGTSFAAPHAAGVLALLLSADPVMDLSTQETILIYESVDRGILGPDNDYGYGETDALKAFLSTQHLRVFLPAIIK